MTLDFSIFSKVCIYILYSLIKTRKPAWFRYQKYITIVEYITTLEATEQMKDYSRNSYRTNKPKFSSKHLGNTMLAFAIVFALAALVNFTHAHWDVAHNVLTTIKTLSQKTAVKKENVVVNKKPDTKKITADTKPRFDFYKLLPEMTVTIPKKDDHAKSQSK